MIRLTFITGAGKQGRQKYDEGAAKAVTSTLMKLGFSEDRGASCVVECAGCFKLQHDTGKNLKTVVVFPNVLEEAPAGMEDDSQLGTTSSALLPADTPEYMIGTASFNVFQRMITSKCSSWSQKKECLAALEKLNQQLADLDAKMVKGSPLDKDEQAFYELVADLDEKESHMRSELHTQVENGILTEEELSEVIIPHNAERVAALKNEVKEGNNKKAAMQLEKAQQRKAFLKEITPSAPAPLRYEATLRKLRKELLPILELHLDSKKMRTMRETQQAARQEELEEEIMDLEEASRGWFEADDAFDRRIKLSRVHFAATQKSKAAKKSYSSAAGSTRTVGIGKWVLPGDMKKAQAAGSGNQKKKKKKRTAGAVFSAMMIESSDEEEEDSAPAPSRNRSTQEPAAEKEEPPTAPKASGGGSKKNKKKSKNKKKNNQSEEAALNEVLAAKKQKDDAEAKAKQEVANPYLDFFTGVLLPSVAAILAWLVTLVFGKPKTNKNKRN